MAPRGVILLAHGARDHRWSEPSGAVRERLAALAPGVPDSLAFPEFMTPGLADPARRLVALGCRDHRRPGAPRRRRARPPRRDGADRRVRARDARLSIGLARGLREDALVQDAMARVAPAALR